MIEEKVMKKGIKIVLMLMALMLLTVGCAKKESASDATDNNVTLANPWSEVDKDTFVQKVHVSLNVPEWASDVKYRVLDDGQGEPLGEMIFYIDGFEYVARTQGVGEYTDISGMYYDWTYEDKDKVSYNEVDVKKYVGDDEQATVCMWYDIVPGIMYSVSTVQPDLDGLDIVAIAIAVYEPMQGEAG